MIFCSFFKVLVSLYIYIYISLFFSTSTLTDNHSENNFNTLHSNKQTMLAAKEAERQLDDLLYSLKQFKVMITV